MGKIVVRGKRVIKVGNQVFDLGAFYLSDFITPNSLGVHDVLKQAWMRVHDDYLRLGEDFVDLVRQYGLFSVYVKEIWNVVNIAVKYRHDQQLFDVADFWQLPNETWTNKFGDCEDTTFLTTSAIRNVIDGWGVKDARVYGVIGLYKDAKGNYYGHGFVIAKIPKLGRWLWIETTMENAVPIYAWLVADFNHLIPVYFTDGVNDYRIDKDYVLLGLTEDYVKQHQQYIQALINYVETGIHTEFKWMHKGRRKPDTSASWILI